MHLKMETGMAAIKPDTLGSAKVGQRKSGQVKVADGVGLAKCDIYQLHRRQSAYGSDDIVQIFFSFFKLSLTSAACLDWSNAQAVFLRACQMERFLNPLGLSHYSIW